MKKEAPRKRKGAHAKDIRWKKRHLKNAKGLTQKTSDEKWGTPKTQRGSCKRPLRKKETPKKRKGAHAKDLQQKKRHPKNAKELMQKTSDEKRCTPKM
jgi:hypothetical protein